MPNPILNAELRRTCAMLLSLAAIAQNTQAADLARSPIILRNGDWAVHRSHDALTDAKVCTGIYKENFNIQLSANALIIAIPDSVQSVRLRFDDDEAQDLRLAKGSERAIGAINISGADYRRLLQSKRLRYAATTGSGSLVNGDIDLNGVNIIRSNIEAGCFGEPIDAPTAQPAAASPECSDGARARMAQKGISAQDIVTICTAP
jgi:hypothetical protein